MLNNFIAYRSEKIKKISKFYSQDMKEAVFDLQDTYRLDSAYKVFIP